MTFLPCETELTFSLRTRRAKYFTRRMRKEKVGSVSQGMTFGKMPAKILVQFPFLQFRCQVEYSWPYQKNIQECFVIFDASEESSRKRQKRYATNSFTLTSVRNKELPKPWKSSFLSALWRSFWSFRWCCGRLVKLVAVSIVIKH